MQGWVRVLPLLTAALAATIPPAPPDAWSRQELLDMFNERTEADYLYRLVETGASNDPTRPSRLRFTMKETECQKSEMKKNIEDCKFKEGGMIQDCTAYLDRGPSKDEILIGCSMVNRRHKRQAYSMAWHCRRRAGCFSITGDSVPIPEGQGRLSDLVKEDLEGIAGNFGRVAEFHTTPGRSLSHDSALDEDANFQPVEGIDQTYGRISFGDSDQDKEDFGIVKEKRSPGVDLPNKARTRSRRARPGCPGRLGRAGCWSSIGMEKFEKSNEEPTLFPFMEQYPGVIKGLDWDLDKKDTPGSHSIFTGDGTKSLEYANPFEVAWALGR